MSRIKILEIIFALVALLILARLFYWQFASSVEKRANFGFSQNDIPAPRGEILASDNFPLATNEEAYLLWATPQAIKEDPKKVASLVAPNLLPERFATMSAEPNSPLQKAKEEEIAKIEDSLVDKLKSKNLVWVLLQRKIPSAAKEAISANKIAGLGFERDDRRLYPESSMAAQTIGFVGSDKFGKDTGYFGLEGFYNRVLKGRDGKSNVNFDPQGFPILIDKFKAITPQKGNSVKTNIDRTIQFIVENKLKEAVSRYGAKDGTVIVEDPKTGKIIAIATYPSYNPVTYSTYDQKLYKNPAVADTYEPGSTFKLVVMSAALDAGAVNPATKCNVCGGPRQIGGYEISTWNKKYYPDSTMINVIEHSDNVGMTFVAEKLGLERFYQYLKKFGFGKATGIDLEEESPGVLRDKDSWREIDLATASFGQGIAVTPIQIIQAVSTIANGGKMIPPTLVSEIIENGKHSQKKTETPFQVISSKAASQITEMMVGAVDNGEAKAFKPKGYRIAGKTGTAQIPLAGHYDPNKTIASFVGFAPADDPKFVMLIRFTEPSSSVFGSETAAPTFFSIAKEIFNYYGIPPSE